MSSTQVVHCMQVVGTVRSSVVKAVSTAGNNHRLDVPLPVRLLCTLVIAYHRVVVLTAGQTSSLTEPFPPVRVDRLYVGLEPSNGSVLFLGLWPNWKPTCLPRRALARQLNRILGTWLRPSTQNTSTVTASSGVRLSPQDISRHTFPRPPQLANLIPNPTPAMSGGTFRGGCPDLPAQQVLPIPCIVYIGYYMIDDFPIFSLLDCGLN